ncbi:cytochrome c oxidase assembly protein [Nocardioides sp. R-C-SC26]|uniref:cytochrome c oxidase assembly protein n=1 Tax=Nocardioides sp. R-C-SC26 TaxID=2870414 RepID=UPI001E3B98A3|nr:cytochrome c oxidase assembly protein [Nocardioides sp. R-C-SC26]
MRLRRRRRLLAVGAISVGITATIVVLLLGGGAPEPEPAGLPDPGRVTGWGLPVMGAVTDLAAIATLAGILAPLLMGLRVEDAVEGPALRALASVRLAAATWGVGAAAIAVLQVSDQFAIPVWRLPWTTLRGALIQTEDGRVMLAQAGLATLIAVASRWLLTPREVWWLFAAACVALLPPAAAGHAASGGSHDTAVVSLALHILAASVWIAGLAALWWSFGAPAPIRLRAAQRFGALATWCVGVVAVSGLINAWVRVGDAAGFATTDYGRIAALKALTLTLVLLVAQRARAIVLAAASRTVTSPESCPVDEVVDRTNRPAVDTPPWSTVARITGIEVLVLAATVGIGVGLSRTPPPVGDLYTTLAETLLSGPIPPPPTPERLLTSVTVSGVGLAVVLLGAAAYIVALITLRRRGESWPWGPTVAWFAGLAVIAYATCGGVGVYSHVMFSAHMVSHMLLSMIAPLLLVLGAPIPLALRALPGGGEPGATGPRHLLAGALRSRPARLLSNPLIAAALFVGSLYVVYFTDLFGFLMRQHLGHAAMEVHFLAVGLLFYENIIGSAPLPRRLPHLARLGLLVLTMPAHAFFAIAIMASDTVLGGGYYELLDRPFSRDLLADQNLGGAITWALSEVPLVMVLVALLVQWFRSDRRDAARYERQAARDDHAELAAYNAWLASISAGGNGGRGPRSSAPPLALRQKEEVAQTRQHQDGREAHRDQ